MKNIIFLCPKCLLSDFSTEEDKYDCDLCKAYVTKIKQNLEKHIFGSIATKI